MKKSLGLAIIATLALAGAARADEWKDVPIVDAHCSGDVKNDPDAHSRSCALQCAHYGYGVIASDGTYLKFDKAGNSKARVALKASKKTDHLRATVEGQREGDTIKVTSISIA